MRTHVVAGGGGVKLHVRERGVASGPAILLIHGWSQTHLCWTKQIESSLCDAFRIVAMDIRGHGQSEAPSGQENYTTGELWADDVAAVIAALGLSQPVLVGWSYGGLIIGDYLRKCGDGSVAGINLVCAAVGIGPAWLGDFIGPGFLENAPLACSEDQAVAIAGVQGLLHASFVQPLAPEDMEQAMAWSMLAHPQVRAHLIARSENFLPEFAKLTRPLLVTYGAADTVVTPAMAEAVRERAPACRMSAYAGVGHGPFLEAPRRFNDELAQFAREAFGRA